MTCDDRGEHTPVSVETRGAHPPFFRLFTLSNFDQTAAIEKRNVIDEIHTVTILTLFTNRKEAV